MDRKSRTIYNAAIAEASKSIATSDVLGAEQLVLIEKAKQAAAQGKMKSAIEWVQNFVDGDKKLIVFATHKFVVDALMDEFGDVAVKITGDVSTADRQVAVDKFQNDDGIKLFVGNIKAAGVGLTLTAASDVLFLEFAWTPGDMEQAEDRAHRIGQANSVTAWYMVSESTIDETIVDLLEDKRTVIDQAIDGRKGELSFSIAKEVAARIVSDMQNE